MVFKIILKVANFILIFHLHIHETGRGVRRQRQAVAAATADDFDIQ